jgi:hypothetical protein
LTGDVGLAHYHDPTSKVPAEMQSEITQVTVDVVRA